jgi:hypothetical protein
MRRSVTEDSTLCVCGHAREAHEHYRRGSDCSLCGAAACRRFRVDRTAPGRSPSAPGLSPEKN